MTTFKDNQALALFFKKMNEKKEQTRGGGVKLDRIDRHGRLWIASLPDKLVDAKLTVTSGDNGEVVITKAEIGASNTRKFNKKQGYIKLPSAQKEGFTFLIDASGVDNLSYKQTYDDKTNTLTICPDFDKVNNSKLAETIAEAEAEAEAEAKNKKQKTKNKKQKAKN